jgi:hypothetical protein
MTLRIIDTESFLLKKFNSRLRIGDAGSRRLRVSVMQGVVDSPTQRYGEMATPRIGDSGVSFFEYEYLREFEAKIGTARKLV